MLLDCGLMFPDADMLGIDLVLPDFTYLRENADRIEGCIVTHGHEDHVGGLAFLLRELSFPIYGSALTLGLARNRIEEAGLLDRTELIPVADGERRKIGPFDCEFIPVTHSVPHGFATAFHTPQGTILHTGDFKLDLTPVDGRLTDLARIGAHRRRARASGCCCPTRPTPTSPGHSPSETTVGEVLLRPVPRRTRAGASSRLLRQPHPPHPADRRRRHRLRPHDRHPRPVDEARTCALAREMGLLHIPDDALIDIEDVGDLDPGEGVRHLAPGRRASRCRRCR